VQVLEKLSMFAEDDLDAAVEAVDEVCNALEEILFNSGIEMSNLNSIGALNLHCYLTMGFFIMLVLLKESFLMGCVNGLPTHFILQTFILLDAGRKTEVISCADTNQEVVYVSGDGGTRRERKQCGSYLLWQGENKHSSFL